MMSHLLVIPKNEDAVQFLQKLLNTLSIVRDVKIIDLNKRKKTPKSRFKSQKHFLQGFGMFKLNPVSFEEIRKNAWKGRN